MNHTNHKKKTIFVHFLIKLLILLILSLSLFLGIGYYASRKLVVNTYSVTANVSSPIRIVHISDLHNAEFGSNNEDLVKSIAEQEPDLIFMTGDMINRDDKDINIIISLISQLQETAPEYYGYGNHETSWEEVFDEDLTKALSDAGAIVVNDDYIDTEVNGTVLRIGGHMGYYRSWGMMTTDIEQATMEAEFADAFESTDKLKILLNHIPTQWVDWEHANDYDVDLVFCGHYHGGCIRIPVLDRGIYAPYVGFFPKYTKGITEWSKATCIQSTGLGTEHLLRIFNPPEILVVNIAPRQ